MPPLLKSAHCSVGLLNKIHMELDQEIFEELKGLIDVEPSNYSEHQLKRLYEKIGWVTFDHAVLFPGDLIIRARENRDAEVFNSIEQISYRPPSKNSSYQRANVPGKSMFYGCVVPKGSYQIDFDSALLAALYEILNGNDEYGKDKLEEKKLTFGVWEVKSLIILAVIMTLKDFYADNNQCNFRESRTYVRIPSQEEEKKMDIICHFLKYHFTKVVVDPNDYIPSAVFSEYVLSKGLNGIYYPGIRSSYPTYSVALAPEVVNKNLSLSYAFEAIAYTKESKHIIQPGYHAYPKDTQSLVYDCQKCEVSLGPSEIEARLDAYDG